MAWLKELKRTLQSFGEPQKPRAERRPATGLEAQYSLEAASMPAGIKNISASGIYLFTEKRLRTGELVTLILREEGQPENSEELQISVHARVAREGEDGNGLSFVLPPGLNMDLWDVIVRNIVSLNDPEQVADLFRTLRTMLFICRLCQTQSEEPILILGSELHPDRKAMLIRIALSAENLISMEPEPQRMRADPKVVASILRDGSWAADELTAQLWTGLFAASCSIDTADDSNQPLVNLLVHVTPIQAKIFVLGCERTLGSRSGAGDVAPGPVVLTAKEIIELTGVHDLYRNATDLAYLFNLGLIRKLFDFTTYQDADEFDITPSSLGLELYKHCHGSRDKLDPQLVEVANAHLSNFIPAPQAQYLDNENPPMPTYTPG